MDLKERLETSRNHLNILAWYHKFRFPYGILPNLRLFIKKFKYAYQRITRGYSDWDLWDFGYYLVDLITCGLRDFSEITNTYPYDIETFEEWQRILKDMSDTFALSTEDFLDTDSLDEIYAADNARRLKFAEGWTWLGERLWDLWS